MQYYAVRFYVEMQITVQISCFQRVENSIELFKQFKIK